MSKRHSSKKRVGYVMHWQKDTQMHSEKSDPDKHTKAWKRTCKRARQAQMAFTSPCVYKSLLWESWTQTLMLTLWSGSSFFSELTTQREKISGKPQHRLCFSISTSVYASYILKNIRHVMFECINGYVSITHRPVSIRTRIFIHRNRNKLHQDWF